MKTNICQKVLARVKKTIEENGMLKGVNKVLIAFSSGPDSVCLLDVLANLYGNRIEFNLGYVNHGLRSQKLLDLEEKLTRDYATKYHLDYKILKIKVTKTKEGIEAKARKERYNALCHYLKEIGAQRIALGHNLNDLVETFFLNLIRGTGLRGLQSMKPVRVPFIRPLMGLKKEEIVSYLKNRKLVYSLDQTNRLLNYRRNLLRHKIMPNLKMINPKIYETIKREIEILTMDEEYLHTQADRAFKRIVAKEDGYFTLDIKKFIHYNKAIVNRVVMNVLEDLRGSLAGFESKHVALIVSLKDKLSGRSINLPRGLYAQRIFDKIVLGLIKETKPVEVSVGLSGKVAVSGKIAVKTRLVSRFDLKERRPNCEAFDLQKIVPPLFIRNQKPGDFLKTEIGRKKIKKILSEKRMVLRAQRKVFMLCDQKGILWILGLRRAFRGFIGPKTKKILIVEYEDLN